MVKINSNLFSPLFEKDNLIFLTQITSKKPRTELMREALDFKKLYYNNLFISAVNLNVHVSSS